MIQFIRENTWIVPIIVAIIGFLGTIIAAIIGKKKNGCGRKQKVGNNKNSKVLNINGDYIIKDERNN